MKRIAVFCSGGGSNLGALMEACDDGRIAGEVVLVVASRKSAGALERARVRGIEAVFLSKKADPDTFDQRTLALLQERGIDLVVLAGYLSIFGEETLAAYSGRILNIHPALLPAFGGVGMYGHHVHEAVLAKGCRVSGATVHFVTGGVDEGPIVLQRAVDVLPQDTVDTLAARVLAAEHQILPAATALFCADKLRIQENKVVFL